MLQRRVGAARIVDAERHCTRTLACEIAHLRIVAVHDERRIRRQSANRDAPALRDVLELAVAVELISEQIAEADGTRSYASDHLRKCGLVDLEQAELRAARLEERRRHPGKQVRAGAVVRETDSRP